MNQPQRVQPWLFSAFDCSPAGTKRHLHSLQCQLLLKEIIERGILQSSQEFFNMEKKKKNKTMLGLLSPPRVLCPSSSNTENNCTILFWISKSCGPNSNKIKALYLNHQPRHRSAQPLQYRTRPHRLQSRCRRRNRSLHRPHSRSSSKGFKNGHNHKGSI